MCGSGTTLDVARELKRKALAYDLQPQRKDIFKVDARKLPIENEKADFVFIDPPYSNHIKYSGDKRCIGELDAFDDAYYVEMEKGNQGNSSNIKTKSFYGTLCFGFI
jgi:adenine-specific DNA-methyltransferase